jgi:hypothetical protein
MEFKAMSNARIFFAGVGTTFVILATGFGAGLMIANSALDQPPPYQPPGSAARLDPVRVILPAPAEAAQSPETAREIAAVPTPAEPQPSLQGQAQSLPVKTDVADAKVEARKAAAEERARRNRLAERKTAKLAAARTRQLTEQQARTPNEVPIMAFGDDQPTQRGFFGN